MDIKQLLRTYTHVNDPKWQNVTVKFAIFALAALALASAAIAINTMVEDPVAAGTPSASETGTEPGTERDCMSAAELAAWHAEHPEAEILEQTWIDGERVCITYRA